MKKLILIFAAVLAMCYSNSALAQCTLPYRALSTFNNDTVAYVNYNFSDRADCYKDKTILDVIADLKIPIKSFLCFGNEENAFLYDGIYIYLSPIDYIRYRELIRGEFFSTISIRWKTPRSNSDIEALMKTTKVNYDNWTPEVENLLKSIPIGKVGSVKR